MNSKVVIGKPVSQKFRSFGLDRSLAVKFWNELYKTLPAADRSDRVGGEDRDRLFIHQISLLDQSGKRFLFHLAVDDASATDTCLVVGIKCITDDDLG